MKKKDVFSLGQIACDCISYCSSLIDKLDGCYILKTRKSLNFYDTLEIYLSIGDKLIISIYMDFDKTFNQESNIIRLELSESTKYLKEELVDFLDDYLLRHNHGISEFYERIC